MLQNSFTQVGKTWTRVFQHNHKSYMKNYEYDKQEYLVCADRLHLMSTHYKTEKCKPRVKHKTQRNTLLTRRHYATYGKWQTLKHTEIVDEGFIQSCEVLKRDHSNKLWSLYSVLVVCTILSQS
jgi:hypothetical protein